MQFKREGAASGDVDIIQQPKTIFDSRPAQFEGRTLDQVRAHTSGMRTSEGRTLLDQGALKQILKLNTINCSKN